MTGHLLVVDDEPNIREVLRIVLEAEGYDVREAETYAKAMQLLGKTTFDLVICDIVLPDGNGLDLVRSYHAGHPDTKFVVVTAHNTPAQALTALREGAVEYLSKPFDIDELKLVIEKQMQTRTAATPAPETFAFIGRSRAMWPVLERIPQVARSDATVLITGESGTGKELLARAIHTASPRAGRLFVPVNCGALPEGLFESELFGHVRGSFTGAVRDKQGLMREADGGTLFLDEIGELTPNTQVKLLRVLQDRKVRPVGGNREFEVDARVIAATNRDLRILIEEAKFREDLYFRIDVINLHVPPLRQRREDIPDLVRHFVKRAGDHLGTEPKEIHRDAMAVLENYSWPGNVRELENVVERTVATESSYLITVSSLPPSILGSKPDAGPLPIMAALPEDGLDIEVHLDGMRRELMRQALERCGGVQKDAARLLHMTYRAFRYHAEKYNLTTED
ncbi:MAG: sigma-54 dependent transcriptional regulator [Acidobacteriia bacterium]|nr:sigma-54 dependent transcriptional regulator [Terriglobia bacterium]